MWELDYKESWALKNWCFWTVVLEKTLESPLPCKEIQQVHSRGNQSWIFFERNDAEAETPIPWPPDAKNWLIWKRPWWWERLKAGGEGDDRGWNGWMASPTLWTRVWVSSGIWWWAVHGIAMSWTWLSDWTEPNHFSVHSSGALSTFTLCNHYHRSSPQLFSLCETETPYSLNNTSLFPHSLPTTIWLIFAYIFFPFHFSSNPSLFHKCFSL